MELLLPGAEYLVWWCNTGGVALTYDGACMVRVRIIVKTKPIEAVDANGLDNMLGCIRSPATIVADQTKRVEKETQFLTLSMDSELKEFMEETEGLDPCFQQMVRLGRRDGEYEYFMVGLCLATSWKFLLASNLTFFAFRIARNVGHLCVNVPATCSCWSS